MLVAIGFYQIYNFEKNNDKLPKAGVRLLTIKFYSQCKISLQLSESTAISEGNM